MAKKLWALLYDNPDEYGTPEVLAVSENVRLLKELAETNAHETFGTSYLTGRNWVDGDGRLHHLSDPDRAVDLQDHEAQSEYVIAEVTNPEPLI